MNTLNVALPERLRKWVEEQVRDGEYSDAGEYVLELIREDWERSEAFVRALMEGEESGIRSRGVDQIIADAAGSEVPYILSEEELADLEAALQEVDRGELASEAEVRAVFARHRG